MHYKIPGKAEGFNEKHLNTSAEMHLRYKTRAFPSLLLIWSAHTKQANWINHTVAGVYMETPQC